MKQWFLQLTQRERVMVQIVALVMAVFLFYLFVLNPVSTRYSKNKNNVINATETLEWMKSASREVIQLRGRKLSGADPQSKQFSLSMVDSSVRKAGLTSVMKRVQPEGDTGVRVWFEDAVFDELMKWLALIEQKHALIVNEINIEQTGATGLVNVRVFLESS